MEDLFISAENSFDVKYLFFLIISFSFAAIFAFVSIKRSIERKKIIIKNYIILNYGIPESDLTNEDHNLISLTFYNTLKNRKIEKIKDQKKVDSAKKIRNLEKKVSFDLC